LTCSESNRYFRLGFIPRFECWPYVHHLPYRWRITPQGVAVFFVEGLRLDGTGSCSLMPNLCVRTRYFRFHLGGNDPIPLTERQKGPTTQKPVRRLFRADTAYSASWTERTPSHLSEPPMLYSRPSTEVIFPIQPWSLDAV
jgi:hypothetical protein